MFRSWLTIATLLAVILLVFPPAQAFLFSFSPAQAPSGPCNGTAYYVSNSGLDTANGTSPTTPWQTIAKVNTHASFTAGQCINFNGGQTFAGNLVLSTVNSCSICAPTPSVVNVTSPSPSNPILVQSYGTGQAILTSNAGGDISSAVLVNSVNGFTVQNLIIRSGISGSCPSGVGANCTTAGVYVTGASTGTVTGNDIGGFYVNDGETIGGGDITSSTRTDSSGTVTISLNTLHGLTTAALDDDGVQVNGSTGTILVSGNVLFNFGGRPSFLATFGGEGMNLLHSHAGTITVSDNIVHDIGFNQTTQCGGSSGIETNDISNGTISGNQVYNTGINITTGCDGDGIDLDGSTTNTVVEYNYTHNNAGAGLYAWMGQSVGDWTNNTYRGNISENDAYIISGNPQEFFGGMSFNNVGCSGCVVYAYGNSIYQNSSLAGRGALVLATQNGSAGIGAGSVIADNIFAYTSTNYAVTCNPALTPAGTWRNNSYFAISGGTNVRVDANCGSAGAPSSTLAQWETRTGETGGTTSSPSFVGTLPAGTVAWNTSGNQTLPAGYVLANGSPLIGVGVAPSSLSVPSILPLVDFYGTAQPNSSGSGWNMGAFGGGTTTPATVLSVAASGPATGLLTATSGSNTTTVTVTFSNSVTVTGAPQLTLNNGTVCLYRSAPPSTTVNFACTVMSGQNTPIAASLTNTSGNTYLGTISSGAINLNGGAISNAALTGANSQILTGLAANTNALYFISTTGTDTGSGTGACSKTAPCATLNFVKGLMESNSTKTVYVLPGTYNVTSAGTFSTVWCNANYPGGDSNCAGQGFTAGGTKIASAMVGLTSTSDNGTSYLGYPGAFPELYGGATSYLGAGVDLPFYIGFFESSATPSVTNITINGFKLYNFRSSAISMQYPGNITVSNNDIENIFDGPEFPTENAYGSPALDGPEGTWGVIYIAHNNLNNIGAYGLDTAQDTDGGSGGQQSGGSITVDSNIVQNTCQTQFDCGDVYAFDSFQNSTQNWTNNILGSVNTSFAEQIYFDFSTSHVNVSGNQVYGNATAMMLWHSGQVNAVTNNLFDMTAMLGQTVGSNWPALAFYQGCWTPSGCTWSEPSYFSAGNNAAGNTFEHNIIWSSVAPLTTSCGELNCGYLWIWSQDSGQTMQNPTLQNNNYYATTGSYHSFGSSPSQSSPSFGPIAESSAITSNPGISFTTGAFGERHYTLTNPPAGWTALQTNQGPH